MIVKIDEGIMDTIHKVSSGARDLVNKYNDIKSGKTSSDLEDASKEDVKKAFDNIKSGDGNKVVDAFKRAGVKYDAKKGAGVLEFKFDVTKVPKGVIKRFTPGKGDYGKYITDYDESSDIATLELPLAESLDEAYTYQQFNQLYDYYTQDSTMTSEDIWSDVYDRYGDEGLADDVVAAVEEMKEYGDFDEYDEYREEYESVMTPTPIPYKGYQVDKNGKLIRKPVTESYDDSSEGRYDLVRTKKIDDWDGFTTEYALYADTEDPGRYITVYGDTDLYDPNDGADFDMEFDNYDDALVWFEDYGEDEEDSDWEMRTDRFDDIESPYYNADLEDEDFDLEEDYWFGGSGKVETDPNTDITPDSEDKIDQVDVNDNSNSEEPEENSNEETGSILVETPGLTLSSPKVTYKDEDDIEGRLEIEINGKTYCYRLNPDAGDMTTSEMRDKISKMQQYSDGKALAYLKKNMHVVNESIVVSEKFDGSDKDEIRTDVINAFNDVCKSPEFGCETEEDIADVFNPVFEVEDTGHGIRVEVRLEAGYDTMWKIADALNKVVQKYDEDAYFDFDDAGIMSAYINESLIESFEDDEDYDETVDIVKVINDVYKEKGEIDSDDAVQEIYKRLEDQKISVDADQLGELIVKSKDMINELNECDLKESFIEKGKEFTSKSGHKIKILDYEVAFSDYDGSPYVYIDYEYEKTNGEKGTSKCTTKDLFNMLLEGKKNPFKSHHVCQGCGNTLDKCTCKVEGLDESLDIVSSSKGYHKGDTVKIKDGRTGKIVHINTNPYTGWEYFDIEFDDGTTDTFSGSNFEAEILDEAFSSSPAVSIKDLKSFFETSDYKDKYANFFEWYDDMVTQGKVKTKNGSLLSIFDVKKKDEAIQPSNIGQHKTSSIDLIEGNDEEHECPLCGKIYKGYPALSREDNKTEICPECGQAEAIQAYLDYKKSQEDSNG